jgi:hypothetical protein
MLIRCSIYTLPGQRMYHEIIDLPPLPVPKSNPIKHEFSNLTAENCSAARILRHLPKTVAE